MIDAPVSSKLFSQELGTLTFLPPFFCSICPFSFFRLTSIPIDRAIVAEMDRSLDEIIAERPVSSPSCSAACCLLLQNVIDYVTC